MGEWLYYNLAAGRSFFTLRNFVADFIPLKLNFIKKTKKWFFESPLGNLGVTYALHI